MGRVVQGFPLPEDAQEYGRVFDAWLKATGEATVFACALKDLLLADILADRGVDVDGVRRRGPRPVGTDAAAGPFEGAYGDGSRPLPSRGS
jgi:hypothetical protein